MNPLILNDQESELSYAYLHAVAAAAGMSCTVSGRHEDAHGIDATITAWGDWGPEALREVTFNVQLKATVSEPAKGADRLSYSLKGVSRYDALRSEKVSVPRILVVLFLPKDAADWLRHSTDELALLHCAYWVLRGAPPTDNASAVTVYLPTENALSPATLRELASSLANHAIPKYALGTEASR